VLLLPIAGFLKLINLLVEKGQTAAAAITKWFPKAIGRLMNVFNYMLKLRVKLLFLKGNLFI
jgi:hypothetical protein